MSCVYQRQRMLNEHNKSNIGFLKIEWPFAVFTSIEYTFDFFYKEKLAFVI